MAVESPANLVFLGLNRLSIEAGLYARFLGYQVQIVGEQFSILTIGSDEIDVQHATSTLGRKALEAQGIDGWEADDLKDPESLRQKYVIPLAQSDLLSDSILDQVNRIKIEIGESELPEKLDADVEYDTRIFEVELVGRSGANTRKLMADVFVDYRNASELESITVNYEFPIPNRNKNDLFTDTDDFYFLGNAVESGVGEFDFETGLNEIKKFYQILCDRPELDLYQ